MKNDRFERNICKILQNLGKSPKFCEEIEKYENFEFAAVQKRDNLVDLEKRCKMSIWL